MDLYCQRCGEPFDQYGVYHGDMDSEEKTRFLHGIDCPCCHGLEQCKETKPCSECDNSEETKYHSFDCKLKRFKKPFRAHLSSALSDILGDDTDGLAAEMEDAEQMMGGEFWE